jgi:uncharacterized membrane-anchored protein YjiN (DUF445 family)
MKTENSRSYNLIRFWASALLISSAALFVVSKILKETHPVWPWLEALSEAALIGALADWFAVTALFRHPFGLPIPHTAIIPKNQERIASTLSRFVQDNFLDPESLAKRLHSAKVAERFAIWLSEPASARTVALQLKDLLRGTLESMDDEIIRGFMAEAIPALSQQIKLAPFSAEIIISIRESDKDGKLFNEIVYLLEKLLIKHNQILETLLSKELPWYIPAFIKQRLYAQFVDAIARSLAAMQADQDHILRKQISHLTDKAIDELRQNPDWENRLQSMLTSLCQRGTILDYLSNLKGSLIKKLDSDQNELVTQGLITVLSFTAQSICRDTKILEKLNKILASMLRRAVSDYGDQAGIFIEDTMRSWDSKLLSAKIEAEVGRDLQFIRINGTVVGGLAGVIIHAIFELIEKL